MSRTKMIAAAIVICIVFAFSMYFIQAKATQAMPEQPIHRYVLKEYEGRVACFEEGECMPFLVTDVIVKDLLPTDRKKLNEGVTVTGAKAMSRALEDYTA